MQGILMVIGLLYLLAASIPSAATVETMMALAHLTIAMKHLLN